MTIEEQVGPILQALVGGRAYPDVAPQGEQPPYITFQDVGGEPLNYLTGESPGKTNARMQISVWARTRVEASKIGAQVEDALRAASALQPEVLTGRLAAYDEATTYRGTMQDFSLNY